MTKKALQQEQNRSNRAEQALEITLHQLQVSAYPRRQGECRLLLVRVCVYVCMCACVCVFP